mmetsp:Transcript_34363/g.83154  ORF Transcript_34363/g.83154 Transcript_34363/m.83154 type:complete len:208 (+) Transcript_34363:1441-2064(+)
MIPYQREIIHKKTSLESQKQVPEPPPPPAQEQLYCPLKCAKPYSFLKHGISEYVHVCSRIHGQTIKLSPGSLKLVCPFCKNTTFTVIRATGQRKGVELFTMKRHFLKCEVSGAAVAAMEKMMNIVGEPVRRSESVTAEFRRIEGKLLCKQRPGVPAVTVQEYKHIFQEMRSWFLAWAESKKHLLEPTRGGQSSGVEPQAQRCYPGLR